MYKAIVFVGGTTNGINRFEEIVKKDYSVLNENILNTFGRISENHLNIKRKKENGKNNPVYYELLEDMRNTLNLSVGYELTFTGEKISEFMKEDKSNLLIFHRSSDETRKAFMYDTMGILDIPVYRVYFEDGYEVPENWDFLVHPNANDFEKQIFDILDTEEFVS